jgi:hypothetical protein
LLCGGAYNAAKYYVYRLIVADGGVQVRFSDLRLSLFPLGLEIRDIKNFPIRDENLVSFAAVNAYLPPTSLFMRKKEVSIEIDRPRFILNDSLLRGRAGGKGLGSSFTVNRIRIRDGELVFHSRDIQCRLLNFNLQSGNLAEGFSFRVDSPHLSASVRISGEPVTLEGNVTGEAHQQGESWKISRFSWQTREMIFNANGRIRPRGAYQFNVSAQGNPERILLPLLEELTVKGLTYANARISREEGGAVRVTADFTAPACRIKENRCRDLAAKVSWDSLGRTLDLDSAFDTGLARSSLRLASRGGATSIAVQDLPAAIVADILDISQDAPLAGMVRRGSLEIDPFFLRGRAELDAAPERPLSQPFVLRGSFDFLRDKKAKRTTFSGENLQTGAGEISVSGQTDTLAGTSTLRVTAALKDLENVAPYSAHYLGIDLLPWKLSGGSGVFELVLDRRQHRKRIDSRFRMSDFQANRQSVTALRGEVRHTPPATSGDFAITAPDLNSKAELAITVGRTAIRFPDVAGEARKIMRILGLDIALDGRIAGDFTYLTGKALPEPEVRGSFTSPRLAFMGHVLERVKGSLRSNLQDIDLAGLDFTYKGGRARAAGVRIDFAGRQFDINGRIQGIAASRLQPDFSGSGDLEISGSGGFMKDPLTVTYHFRDMRYYHDREFSVSGRASLLTDFSGFRLATSGEVANAAGAFPFKLDIGQDSGRYDGSFQFDLGDLDLLIPWKNNIGNMRLLGQIFTGADGGVRSRGVAIFSGRTLSLPNFSHSLDNFRGTVSFVGSDFSLQSLRGQMGGGPVEGNGQLLIAGGGLQRMVFHLQGKGLRLYPMDRASCLVNPDLTLKYEEKKLLLSGTLAFQAVEWQREIDERIVFSTRSELSTAESRIREMLQLDVALNSENILMQNSLGRIRGRFKLRLTGTASFPILSGTCEGSQGEIYFSDRAFNVLKAKLVFNNNFFIDPLLQVESEAFIQNYRIRFDIRGSASRAKPELTASPPLPPQDILALVSLGEVFKRTRSTEVSSQQGGTALVTSKLTEEIKNRANKLLGINLLRIDPVLSGQSTVDTSRLTIGKTISKDLVVVYSTNLSTARQEILYLQYQLSPTISLIAMRNEEGRYSLDLRLRSRR